ncbi:MAG: lyase [Marinicaulis sp.]|nr:lyase [Marinicaulis sp.]
MRLMIGAAVFAVLGLNVGGTAAADDLATIDIQEWEVPYEKSRPRDPFAESENSVWFVGQKTGYLAHLDVMSGEFKKIDLKDGSGPHNLIVGSDGIVWYAGNRTALIGRYDPATEEIEEIPMPDPAARDPHTLVFDKGEENIFFTLQGANMIGRMNIETREVTLVNSKTERSRPYGIKVAPNGDVYVVLLGTNKMAHIDPDTMALTEIDLPREEARPRRMEITTNGRVWYVDYAKGYLGAYDPATEEFEEWAFPQGAEARPYGMASDASGTIWAVATGVDPNMFMGFDSETETWISATPVPSGGGTLRHMHYHEPSGAVWFGADTNTIGRAIVESAE